MQKLLILSLLFISFQGFSQNYVDEIAKNTCECISTLDNSADPEELTTQMGLCILKTAEPYSKKLKRDYKIDLEHIDTQGEELGRVIAVKMLSHCPESLMAMASLASDDDDEFSDDEGTEVQTVKGKITKVDKELFMVFSLTDENGKASKYYWMTYVDSENGVIGGEKSLVGKDVKISYERLEFYDPKIEEYRLFNVISSFNLSK